MKLLLLVMNFGKQTKPFGLLNQHSALINLAVATDGLACWRWRVGSLARTCRAAKPLARTCLAESRSNPWLLATKGPNQRWLVAPIALVRSACTYVQPSVWLPRRGYQQPTRSVPPNQCPALRALASPNRREQETKQKSEFLIKKHKKTKNFTAPQSNELQNNFVNLVTLEQQNKQNYNLEVFKRSNQDTCLMHKPLVTENTWIQSGDALTDCASSVGGELSLGQNLLIAYMPWEGYNFEDAILISERLVMDDLYTSVHIERYELQTQQTKLGVEEITRNIADVSEHELTQLDSFGVIKIGSYVEEGSILVGKTTPILKKKISQYQKLLYAILEKQVRLVKDSSLRAPKGIKAKVIDIKYFLKASSKEKNVIGTNKTNKKMKLVNSKLFFSNSVNKLKLKKNKIFLKYQNFSSLMKKHHFSTQNTQLKLWRICINSTLSLSWMRFLKTKNNLKTIKQSNFSTLLLNKLRKNASINNLKIENNQNNKDQNLKKALIKNTLTPFYLKKTKLSHFTEQRKELLKNVDVIHVYLAEKRKVQVGDKMAGRHGNKGIISQILPIQDMPFLPDGTPIDMVLNPLGVPSRMNVGQIYECLLGLAGHYLGENYKISAFDEIYGPEASRSFVLNKLKEARVKTGKKWLFNKTFPGKIRLADGRNGEFFDQQVTVGKAYMLRLVHMVDDKIHARSTGPYSLVTQQPLRGRSKQGGQRLGEMEVWAIEGYGAAFTLLEMLTLKSDDMTGRMALWSNLILNKDVSIGTPESFKVLICELQALCLDIALFRHDTSVQTKEMQKTSLKEIDNLINLP